MYIINLSAVIQTEVPGMEFITIKFSTYVKPVLFVKLSRGSIVFQHFENKGVYSLFFRHAYYLAYQLIADPVSSNPTFESAVII